MEGIFRFSPDDVSEAMSGAPEAVVYVSRVDSDINITQLTSYSVKSARSVKSAVNELNERGFTVLVAGDEDSVALARDAHCNIATTKTSHRTVTIDDGTRVSKAPVLGEEDVWLALAVHQRTKYTWEYAE